MTTPEIPRTLTSDTPEASSYWLDVAVRDILARYPEGELITSSGISPSASYHIGHFREIMTAEALAWGLRRAGRAARHIHVVDNFDPLRKWYPFLPPADKDYAGWPVSSVPDPMHDGHASYADHFYAEFAASLAPMGLTGPGLTIMKGYEDLYRTGVLAPQIRQVLERGDDIRTILVERFNRTLASDWLPVSYIGADGKFVKAVSGDWDPATGLLAGIPLDDGRVKLDWRLDWPARWAALGVRVEPFGAQEHGAAGSSYDTGSVFAREVFGIEPPYGEVRYGHIHRPGEPYKMSSSKGNGVRPAQALAIMPAPVLRYFIVRSRPENKLIFDPGLGLIDLVDEFAAAQNDVTHPFRDAYEFAVDGDPRPVVSTVPFAHLVAVWQAARYDAATALDVLARTGYAANVAVEREVIIQQFAYVDGWIKSFAPASVIFEVQTAVPVVELSDAQMAFLDDVASRVEPAPLDGEAMHQAIYAAKDAHGLKPAEAFRALYRVILAQDSGPKAGWFLSSLDRVWLVARLRRQA